MGASPDDDSTAAAQQRVGRTLRQKWRLDKLLGIGGMAAVYAATHRNGNRAAVKILHEELASIPEIRTRFLREGYVANTVAHAGSVRVIDDDTDEDGTTYLVMDLLEGETLAERWERRGKRLFAAEVCTIADHLLEVLAVAHEKSIVHRDVKPENIFLTNDNKTKLLDFGFARVTDAAQQVSAQTGVRLTLGTPAFMPPEQAAGRWADVDPRSDLWALGATMFTALSGQYVHEGRTVSDVLIAAATKPARSLRSVAPHLPPAVVAVVERALAFDKPMRWPDARAMQKAVREAGQAAARPSKPAIDEGSDERTLIVDERTIMVTDEPTIPAVRARTAPTAPSAPAVAPRVAPRSTAPRPPAPRPASAAPPPMRPAAGSSPAASRAASQPAPPRVQPPSAPPPRPRPAVQVDDDNADTVSETMLAVMVDTSGAPLAGVPRISDPGPPPSQRDLPPESAPGSAGARVIVETTPYSAPSSSPSAPLVQEPQLPRGFRAPAPSSPFWGQSGSGTSPAPTPDQLRDALPPMRAQQKTLPAIGGRAQTDAAGSNRPMIFIAGAAGFLFILFAGMIVFLFLR